MTTNDNNRRIKFAYYKDGWSFENGDPDFLKEKAEKIIPSEYKPKMNNALFCPVCYTNLNRVPKEKEHFSNGRESYFAHTKKYKHVRCGLRSNKPEGKRYDNWEQAKQAIDDDKLVVISGFLKTKPEVKQPTDTEYQETLVEDMNGPLAEVPIGRHNGETFALPSKITTVNGLCRNFDENFYKFFHLPGAKFARRLSDLLKDVRYINQETDEPGFYYGKIESTNHLGEFKRPSNFRMTYFEYKGEDKMDFCLKTQDKDQKAHGIGDDSLGRFIICYSPIKKNGTGLCFEDLGWGEFALLPTKYNYLLE